MKMFFNIGKKRIYEAIGLSDDSKITTTTYSTHPTNCMGCEHFQYANFNECISDSCKSCPHVIRETKTVYHYEQKKCTPKKSTLNTIKLDVLLHTHEVDVNGIIHDFDVESAAKQIGCHKKTIITSLNTMADQKQIAFCQGTGRGLYTICLSEYKVMYDKAENGGMGYFSISSALTDIIYSSTSLNDIRLLFRLLDLFQAHDSELKTVITMDVKSLQQYFPAYVTQTMLFSLMEKLQQSGLLFCQKQNRYNISTTLQQEHKVKQNKIIAYKTAQEHFGMGIRELNHNLIEYNKQANKRDPDRNPKYAKAKNALVKAGIKIAPYVSYIQGDKHLTYPVLSPITVNKKDLDDLSQMSVEYGIDIVHNTLISVYNDILALGGDDIKNLGGLVRSFIREWLNAPSFFQAA